MSEMEHMAWIWGEKQHDLSKVTKIALTDVHAVDMEVKTRRNVRRIFQ